MVNIFSGNMKPRERVLKTYNYEKTDRIPINYMANMTVHKRLCKKLNVSEDNYNKVLEILGVDFRDIPPKYIGKPLFEEIEGRLIDPLWGTRTRWVKNEFGGYWDYCDFPLADADLETVENWPMPNPDDFDYDLMLEQCKKNKDYAIYFGNGGLGDIINSTGMIRGVENTLMDLITDNEVFNAYVDRKIKTQFGIMERALHKCKDYLTFVWMGEDLGTQHTPLISKDLYRKQIKPRQKLIVDLANSYNKPVMIHTCGSSSWAYEDFIDMGVKAVDTLQPEATNMDPEYLVEHFGGRLAFHGCISTAKLANYTPDEVEQNVKEILNIMMKNGGYLLSPTHLIQDNTPVENILTMYETAHKFGRY